MTTDHLRPTPLAKALNALGSYIDPLRQVVATSFVATAVILFNLLAICYPVYAGSHERIVSLSLASDEILMDMLPTCGGLTRIAGLSVFADDPAASSVVDAAKAIKGRVHSEPESLFALKPDLVIAASFNRPELIKMIRDRKVPLLMLERFSSADDIAEHITKIGDAIDCRQQASHLNSKLAADLKTNKPSGPPIRVVNYSPDLTLMGKETLFDDMVTRAGLINAASAFGLTRWPRIDTETLMRLKPDKIIIWGDDSAKMRKTIKTHAAWSRLDAVRKDQFIFIDAKTALSTSHYFGKAVATLSQQQSHQVKKQYK